MKTKTRIKPTKLWWIGILCWGLWLVFDFAFKIEDFDFLAILGLVLMCIDLIIAANKKRKMNGLHKPNRSPAQ